MQTPLEVSIELNKLATTPIGKLEKFEEACEQHIKNNSKLWVPLVQEAYLRAVSAYQPIANSFTLEGQHIYGVCLFASTSIQAKNKTSNLSISFKQGDLLRLERKDNDTWLINPGIIPNNTTATTAHKGEVHTSLVQVVCSMYRLKETDEEYLKVRELFGKTGTFVSVDRIQNTALWQDFYLRRERMFRRLGAEGLNEKLLWHGCSGPVVLPIASNGFDWRLCGLHGTLKNVFKLRNLFHHCVTILVVIIVKNYFDSYILLVICSQ